MNTMTPTTKEVAGSRHLTNKALHQAVTAATYELVTQPAAERWTLEQYRERVGALLDAIDAAADGR